MATLPRVFRKIELTGNPARPAETVSRLAPTRVERDPFELRALPLQDVIFYSKKIDNSRLVREADTRGRINCRKAIGVAAVLVAMLTGTLAPAARAIIAGYRLEALRSEERRLLDERKSLELEEAALLNPARLEKLAKAHDLYPPAAGQVIHLDSKPDSAVALAK
jgi:hypothetical protein